MPTKETLADTLRKHGISTDVIHSKKHLRYRNPVEKGIYWYWVSQYVRKRDAKLYGTCISCGKPATWQALQAGHFMPAGSCGFSLLFDLRNLNGECGGCNGFDTTHLLKYAENLDKRYGSGTSLGLRTRYDKRNTILTKEWKKADYEREIPIIRAKLAGL